MLLLTSGCRDPVDLATDLRIDVFLSTDVASPGDLVLVTIRVSNLSDHALSLGDACKPVSYRVLDQQGERVGPMEGFDSHVGCLDDPDNRIRAFGNKKYVHLWGPYLDYWTPSAPPLEPGTYQVIGGLAGEPLGPPISDPVPIRVVEGGTEG